MRCNCTSVAKYDDCLRHEQPAQARCSKTRDFGYCFNSLETNTTLNLTKPRILRTVSIRSGAVVC